VLYWAQHSADLGALSNSHFNREIADSLRSDEARTPFVTLITDLADYRPLRIERSRNTSSWHGTRPPKALAVGLQKTYLSDVRNDPEAQILREDDVDRVAERSGSAWNPIVRPASCFRRAWSKVMVDITGDLRNRQRCSVILICGHNEKLAAELKALKTTKPILVVGFAQNVEYYMALADFFVGKPGRARSAKAPIHLPVIVECNSATLPQERYNAEW